MIRSKMLTLRGLVEGVCLCGDIHVTVVDENWVVQDSEFYGNTDDLADEDLHEWDDLEVWNVFTCGADGRLHIDLAGYSEED